MLGIEDFIKKFIKIVVFECIFRIKDEFNSPGELKVNERNIPDLNFVKPEVKNIPRIWDMLL